MYAGLLWCAGVIVVLMADLRDERRVAVDQVDQHVGQQPGANAQIEGVGEQQGALAHRGPSQRLSPTQQFVIDLGDLFQDLSNLGVVGQALADLLVVGLGNVVHPRRRSAIAHRKVVLGSVSLPVGAPAVGIAAALVALDQGTSKDGVQRWQLAQKLPAASLEIGGGWICHL